LIANAAPKFAEDLNILFGGNTKSSAIALAEANAQAAKTAKDLAEAQSTTENAIKDFEKGTLSASQALIKVINSTASVSALMEKNQKAIVENAGNKSTGGFATARNIFTLGGLVGESSGERNKRIDEENAKLISGQKDAVLQANELRQRAGLATVRQSAISGIAAGQSTELLKQNITTQLGDAGPEAIRKQRSQLLLQANQAQKRGDTQTADALIEQAESLRKQADDYEKSIDNVIKEQERLIKSLQAMDLGLRGPASTASAMSAAMDRFAAQIDGKTIPAISALEFLKASVTSAGVALDNNELSKATNDVVGTLTKLGASESSINKFKANTEALNAVQSRFGQVSADIISEQKKTGKALTPTEILKEFKERLGQGLPKEIQDIIGGIELTDEIKDKIAMGDFSGIADALGEKAQKFLEPVQKILQDYQNAQNKLIELTKTRIDSERNYAQSIKEAQDLIMEGREIQAKYGGPQVTQAERRSSILTRANATNQLTGLTGLTTGSIEELRSRNQQIRTRFAGNQAATRIGVGAGTASGEIISQQQTDLKQAQKDQIQTIRELIKLEEENLKLIGEKNKIEKDSIDALLSGDVEKFFDLQAAEGAKAAIATGNVSLQQAYGSTALATAAQDLKRMQEAGVQSLYGQQLGGAGGLTERAYGAAIQSRGIQDPRLAQMAAGTTMEEELSKSRLRSLGGVLGETGVLGQDLAQMEVAQAQINVANAEIIAQQTLEAGIRANEQAANAMGAAAMSRGGVVYASNGIFVPRGTDTIPAMLTPGEFVVSREAVQRGNNLQILQAMNRGSSVSASESTGTAVAMSRGGKVRYRQDPINQPEPAGGVSIGNVDKLVQALNSFNTTFSDNITRLTQSSISIKLDSTNVNINLSGGAFLEKLTSDLKQQLLKDIGNKLANYRAGDGGKLTERSSVL